MRVIRTETLAQRAGVYYIRIQAMARKYHIALEQEFDAHDTPDAQYILLLDDDFPAACCRLYPESAEEIMLGRVVVLPEYRGQGLGSRAVLEAERWAAEQGFRRAVLESRTGKTGFYEKLGYAAVSGAVIHGETFDCIRMTKELI
ncbi:MAG TPA: N-acetyltransferase [Ruminococcus sp.]|nr:N-acetyltransferase [Ruminococcus sp.]